MKKLSFLIVLVAFVVLFVLGGRTSMAFVVDFESLTPGASVEGLGIIPGAPDLNIQATFGDAVVVAEGDNSIKAYGAPNILPIFPANGCLGNPGVLPSEYGQGFSDLESQQDDGASEPNTHHYVFTFSPDTTVREFSITMLDYGDYNPNNATSHLVQLIAYDGGNNVVDLDQLSYNSDTALNPRSSDVGDLWFTGDACTANQGEPGFYTFSVEAPEITRVELKFPTGIDPKIAFDNITGTITTTEPFCGDGNLDPGEQCDDGNNIDGDGCSANCTTELFCGDGYLDPGEQCDDGNNVDGDGCSAICTIEEDCGECDGKVTVLTLQYTGGNPALIRVEQKKDGTIVFEDQVQPNETFTFSGEDKKGTLGPEIFVYTDGVQNTKIHTSCSQDIYPGMVSGAFTVVKGYSLKGGLLCPLE